MFTKEDKTEIRERRIDEALKESFPASDPPFFMGAGMLQSEDGKGVTNDDHVQERLTGVQSKFPVLLK